MQTVTDALAASIEHAARVVLFFTEDLKGSDFLHRPCPNANCAAWTLGHLSLSARGMMTRAGATDLPPLPTGFEKKYARDETAPKASDFGDTADLRPVFEQTHKLFADFVRRLDAAKLATPIDPNHPVFKTVGSMLAFAPVHIGTHAGQISTIRRSLGRPPLV